MEKRKSIRCNVCKFRDSCRWRSLPFFTDNQKRMEQIGSQIASVKFAGHSVFPDKKSRLKELHAQYSIFRELYLKEFEDYRANCLAGGAMD